MSNSPYALAIWSDIAPGVEIDYRHWLTREHMLERVSVDGFVSGRAYCALDRNLRRYFIVYELAGPDVLAGPSYLARLNDPTPWSRRIMPELQKFSRGGGRISATAGLGNGGIVAPIRFDLTALPAARQGFVDRVAALDGVSRVWLLEVDRQGTQVATNEKNLRKGGEGVFDGLLVIEGVEERPVLAAAQSAIGNELAAAAPEVPVIFSNAFAIDRRTARLPQ